VHFAAVHGGGSINDAPAAIALFIAVEIAATGSDFHGSVAGCAMIGLGVYFTLGFVATHNKQSVGHAVNGGYIVACVLLHPGDKFAGAA